MKFLKISVLLLALLFVIISCQKELLDHSHEQGDDSISADATFNLENIPNTSTSRNGVNLEKELFIEDVKAYFKENPNKARHFDKKYGYAVFNASSYYNKEGGKVLIVPALFENSELIESVVIIFRKNNTFKFRVLERDKIKTLPKKKDIEKKEGKYQKISRNMAASFFAYFDYRVLKANDCELISILDPLRDIVCITVWYETETCYCSESGGYVTCYDCYETYSSESTCVIDGNTSTTTTTGGSTGGTSWEGDFDSRPDPLEDSDPDAEYVLDIIDEEDICNSNTVNFFNKFNIPKSHQNFSAIGACCDGFSFDENCAIEMAFNLSMDDDDERVNSCERVLILQYPGCAYKINGNRTKAYNKTAEIFGFNKAGDCSDAFRHTYFNYLNSKSCGVNTAKLFGDAHECEVPADELNHKEMDLYNNEWGRQLYTLYPNVSTETIIEHILNMLRYGQLKIINAENNADFGFCDV